MKARIIIDTVELKHLWTALHNSMPADRSFTYGFKVEIETEKPLPAQSSPHEETEAQAQRRFQASLCPKCAYPGTSIGHVGLLACEAETCSVVLFKGAA